MILVQGVYIPSTLESLQMHMNVKQDVCSERPMWSEKAWGYEHYAGNLNIGL